MSGMLLIPMAVCLLVGFAAAGILLNQAWKHSRLLYPVTVSKLRASMMRDRHSRYLFERYAKWCSMIQSKYTPEQYLFVSLLGSVAGFLLGLLTRNIVIAFCLFLLALLCPTLVIYARYTVKRNRMVTAFSQFLDLYSRHYSSRRNIVLAFREMVDECPKDIQPDLIYLNNNLADGGNPVQAVEHFAERIGHDWAYDFSTYIISGLEGETDDIQAALNRLTNEMFVYQDEKEEMNSEIYAIWISLIIVIAICILFLPYNQFLLPEAYRLYFFTPDGQALLSVTVTVWCLSVLLAFIWGRRVG